MRKFCNPVSNINDDTVAIRERKIQIYHQTKIFVETVNIGLMGTVRLASYSEKYFTFRKKYCRLIGRMRV